MVSLLGGRGLRRGKTRASNGLRAVLASLVFAVVASPVAAGVTPIGGGFSNPVSVAVNGAGDVFVFDVADAAIQRIPSGCMTSACVTTIAHEAAYEIAVDPRGDLFIPDGLGTIKKYTQASNYASGVITGSGFQHISAIAVDQDENLYVFDLDTSTLYELLAANNYQQHNAVFDSGGQVYAIAVDQSGDIFVTDQNGIEEMVASDGFQTRIRLAVGNPHNVHPYGLALDAAGNLYFTDSTLGELSEITVASGYQTVVTLASASPYWSGVAVGADGAIYLAYPPLSQVQVLAAPAAPAAPSVPTLGPWALLALAGMLGGAAVCLRRPAGEII